jgi:dienelactone hydrolase
MKSSCLAWALLWLVGISVNVRAQQAPAARVASPSLDGMWRGTLPVPGGKLELSFRLIALTGGTYFAALDVPMQKLVRVPVTVQQPANTDSVLFLVPQINSRFLARRSADGQLLNGLWCRPDLRTPVQLRHVPLAPAAGPAGQPTRPYREEEITFSNFTARLKLVGTLTMPAGPGPFPAAVLVSDLGKQDRDGLAPDTIARPGLLTYRLLGSLADYLTRHGVAVLRFDDRGVGKSAGSNDAATPAQRTADVQAALNFLRTRPDIDLLRLGLVGHGEGANIALLVAAARLRNRPGGLRPARPRNPTATARPGLAGPKAAACPVGSKRAPPAHPLRPHSLLHQPYPDASHRHQPAPPRRAHPLGRRWAAAGGGIAHALVPVFSGLRPARKPGRRAVPGAAHHRAGR